MLEDDFNGILNFNLQVFDDPYEFGDNIYDKSVVKNTYISNTNRKSN